MGLKGVHGLIDLRQEPIAPILIPVANNFAASGYFVVDADLLGLGDPVRLYAYPSGGPGIDTAGYYHKDELDRVYLHSSLYGAINNEPSTQIDLSVFAGERLALAIEGSGGANSEVEVFLSLASPFTLEDTLESFPVSMAAYLASDPTTTERGWKQQGQLTGWRLSPEARIEDTSLVGALHADAMKVGMSGSGTLDFKVNLFGSSIEHSIETLLRMSLMQERGYRADARFMLRQFASEDMALSTANSRMMLGKALWLETTILITAMPIDVRADSLIEGSADFTVVAPIRPRIGIVPS